MSTKQALGKVTITPKGAYDGSTTYERLDVVTYNGSSYMALQQTIGNLPTNTTYWELLAEKGSTGEQGETGAQGPQGEPGGSPLAASSTSGMTDTTKVYVNTTDGKWYYNNGATWVAGGAYQAAAISETDPVIKSIFSFSKQQGDIIINKKAELDLETGDLQNTGLPWDGNHGRLRTRDIIYANEDMYIMNSAYIKYYLYTFDDFNYTNPNGHGWVMGPTSVADYYKINAGTYFKLLIAKSVEASPAEPAITIIEDSVIYKNIVIYNEKDLLNSKKQEAYTSINNNYVNATITDENVLLKEKGYVGTNGVNYYGGVQSSTANEYLSSFIPFNKTQTLVINIKILNGQTNSNEPWTGYALYDDNFDFISGTRTTTGAYTVSGSDRIQNIVISNVPANTRYIKASYRTYNGIEGKITITSNLLSNIANNQFKSFNCESVAHQGYSITSQQYGNSRLSSYIGAKEHGFSWAECDVQWSSDGIPVCCHDASFVSNGTTVVIASHTVQELKTYNYYGETIATLEEVIALCKKINLGLYIDKVDSMTQEQLILCCNLVKKYQMLERTKLLVNSTFKIEYIQQNYANLKVSLVIDAISADAMNTANRYATKEHPVGIDFNYASNSVNAVKSIIDQLNPYVELECWTIDDTANYIDYLPYMKAITSNKISYNDVYDSLISD